MGRDGPREGRCRLPRGTPRPLGSGKERAEPLLRPPRPSRISSFGVHDALNQAMDPRFRGACPRGNGGMTSFERDTSLSRRPSLSPSRSFPRKRESITPATPEARGGRHPRLAFRARLGPSLALLPPRLHRSSLRDRQAIPEMGSDRQFSPSPNVSGESPRSDTRTGETTAKSRLRDRVHGVGGNCRAPIPMVETGIAP